MRQSSFEGLRPVPCAQKYPGRHLLDGQHARADALSRPACAGTVRRWRRRPRTRITYRSGVYDNLIRAVRESSPGACTATSGLKLAGAVHLDESAHVRFVHAAGAKRRLDVPYEEALRMVKRGCCRLGEAYQDGTGKSASASRWIDVYENEGKMPEPTSAACTAPTPTSC